MTGFKPVAVIPARMASSRFPGKPLVQIHGLPMVEHVRRRALLSGSFSQVVVATCDAEIKDTLSQWKADVMMTSPDHPAATDRVSEAVKAINDCSHVVNVQGDEILIVPEELRKMVEAMKQNPDQPAWNAVAPIQNPSNLGDNAVVKCVVSRTNRILYCSRDYSNIPFKEGFDPARIILGILGYRKDFLLSYGSLARTPGEVLESIDQNRIVESDIPLQGVPFARWYPGINDKREKEDAEKFLKEDPVQQAVLKKVLGFYA